MKGLEPEKPPNHERWIISYADFTTLLLATFVVMYAVSSINSGKLQEMAEALSTAFVGRNAHVQASGFAAGETAPFNNLPMPFRIPLEENKVKNEPPTLRREKAIAEPNQKVQSGSATARSQRVEQRVQSLDATYDKLMQALAPLIGKGQVRVSLQSLGVVIDINEMLLFNSGKADLTTDALPLIDEIAKIIADLRYQIQVNGFTDDVPIHTAQFDTNWDLSTTRAMSVVKRFIAQGIEPGLLVGAGFGEYHPIASNLTPEGKAQNRRVSIVVVSPLDGRASTRTQLLGAPRERAGDQPASPPPIATTLEPRQPPPPSSPEGLIRPGE